MGIRRSCRGLDDDRHAYQITVYWSAPFGQTWLFFIFWYVGMYGSPNDFKKYPVGNTEDKVKVYDTASDRGERMQIYIANCRVHRKDGSSFLVSMENRARSDTPRRKYGINGLSGRSTYPFIPDPTVFLTRHTAFLCFETATFCPNCTSYRSFF